MQHHVRKSILLPFDKYSRLLHESKPSGEASAIATVLKDQTGEGELEKPSKNVESTHDREESNIRRHSEVRLKRDSIMDNHEAIPDDVDEEVQTTISGPPGVRVLKRKLEDSKKKKKKKLMSAMRTKWISL
jgi:hypothetical protein